MRCCDEPARGMRFAAQLRLTEVTDLDVDNLEELFQGGYASLNDVLSLPRRSREGACPSAISVWSEDL